MGWWFSKKEEYASDYNDLREALLSPSYVKILTVSNNCNDIDAYELRKIGRLKNLNHLDLNGVNLDPFPFRLQDLKKLQTLRISNCQIKSFPSEIKNLEHLFEITLYASRSFEGYDILSSIPRMQTLNLTFMDLTEIPPGILQIKKLGDLSIYGSNLQKIPSEIVQLINLSDLSLMQNEIEELPDSIGELKNLVRFQLNSNKLKSLPAAIASMPKLCRLDITENPFTHLPAELKRLDEAGGLKVDNKDHLLFGGPPEARVSDSIDFAKAPKFLAADFRINPDSFSFSEECERWEAEVVSGDDQISLSVEQGPTQGELPEIVQQNLKKIESGWDEIQRNIIDNLLELYNDEWSDPEGELPTATANEFLDELYLESIGITEGSIDLYFGDNELFAGHSIELFWDLENDRMYEAALAG